MVVASLAACSAAPAPAPSLASAACSAAPALAPSLASAARLCCSCGGVSKWPSAGARSPTSSMAAGARAPVFACLSKLLRDGRKLITARLLPDVGVVSGFGASLEGGMETDRGSNACSNITVRLHRIDDHAAHCSHVNFARTSSRTSTMVDTLTQDCNACMLAACRSGLTLRMRTSSFFEALSFTVSFSVRHTWGGGADCKLLHTCSTKPGQFGTSNTQ